MLDTKPCQHCGQWEGWHCSQISSFIAHYKHEASSKWTFSLGLPRSALMNGRKYRTVVRVISFILNFILFTPQLALWRIARICRTTILYLSTDSALVILDSLTDTFCVVMIHRLVSFVDFLFPWDTSWSNVSVCGTFIQNILQSLLLQNCFKVWTIVLLLILLIKLIFITNCNDCYSNFTVLLTQSSCEHILKDWCFAEHFLLFFDMSVKKRKKHILEYWLYSSSTTVVLSPDGQVSVKLW